MGCEVVKVYKDHGISGAKGATSARHSMRCDATKRQFDIVMARSVDCLGRSLSTSCIFAMSPTPAHFDSEQFRSGPRTG
jgi:DNA invertase Pin-like site-specific DNA recombinase